MIIADHTQLGHGLPRLAASARTWPRRRWGCCPRDQAALDQLSPLPAGSGYSFDQAYQLKAQINAPPHGHWVDAVKFNAASGDVPVLLEHLQEKRSPVMQRHLAMAQSTGLITPPPSSSATSASATSGAPPFGRARLRSRCPAAEAGRHHLSRG